MKPKLSSLCLLLSVSGLTILPVVSEDTANTGVKTEAPIPQEKLQACYAAIQSEILQHLNPEVRAVNRFSRVKQAMPNEYFTHEIVREDADGIIEFRIVHIKRLADKPNQGVVATGTFDSKSAKLLLKNEQSGEFVAAAEHPLLKKKSDT